MSNYSSPHLAKLYLTLLLFVTQVTYADNQKGNKKPENELSSRVLSQTQWNNVKHEIYAQQKNIYHNNKIFAPDSIFEQNSYNQKPFASDDSRFIKNNKKGN